MFGKAIETTTPLTSPLSFTIANYPRSQEEKMLGNQRGFSLVELLVAVFIFMLVSSLALPQLSAFRGQMQASQDIRNLAQTLGEIRSEAIRLKANIRVSFRNEGYEWDIFDDSAQDGSLDLSDASTWDGSTPSDLVFNGLGLLRGVGANGVTITIDNRGQQMSLQVNRNGYIEL